MDTSPRPDPQTGLEVLRAFLRERSPLGPLRVMYQRIGRVFQIPLPRFHPFVAGGPEAARRVYVTDRDKVRWRLEGDPVVDLLRRGVLVTDGEEHDHLRSIMEVSLQPGQLPGYVEMIVRQTDRVAATWEDGREVDLLVEGRRIALLIVMEALFGVDFWDEMPRLWRPILKAIQYISPGAWVLFPRLPRPGYRRHLQTVDEYLYGLIRLRRERNADTSGASNPKHDLLQHLMDAGLDDGTIRDQMLTMLIAGHDTSTALLAWTFYLLGAHPEVMARLQSELDGALAGAVPSAPGGWQPPLLDAVIKEALRLYPPIHIGNRRLAEPLQIEGVTVPAGERLMLSSYLTHRDPAHWEHPDEFLPERFAHGRRQPPMAFIPFGGGPRACIGAAFAQVEARLVIARLLQSRDFVLTRPHVHAHMGATLEPRPGVFMRTTRRKTSR